MAMDVHLVTCDFGSVNGTGPFPAAYLHPFQQPYA